MTENKDDLISREALKIEIEKQIAYYDDKSKHQSDIDEFLRYRNTTYGLRLAHNYIDNAPTVDIPNYGGQVIPDTLQGWRYEERPQGKWIEKEETPASVSYYCSVCKIAGIPITPFCPNCGADMRGKSK